MKHFAFLLLVWVGCFGLNCAAAEGKIVVRAVTGKVKIDLNDGNEPKRLRVGNSVYPGQTILTGAGSRADLFLGSNGPIIELEERTKLKIEALKNSTRHEENQTVLYLASGRIQGLLRPFQERAFVVNFIGGEALLHKAHRFQMDHDGTVTTIGGAEVVISGEKRAVPPETMFDAKRKTMTAVDVSKIFSKVSVCTLPSKANRPVHNFSPYATVTRPPFF